MEGCFKYGQGEMEYLAKKDRNMAAVVARFGKIERRVTPDLFEAFVDSIIGQQISAKAHVTVMGRFRQNFPKITPGALAGAGLEDVRRAGMSVRKASYIISVADEIMGGRLNLDELHAMDDEEVCKTLCRLPGVGRWTAEMLMIFSMQRPNVLSLGDLAIRRGLCRMHGHREITAGLYEKYKKRYSPFCSVASLFIWAVAGEQQ